MGMIIRFATLGMWLLAGAVNLYVRKPDRLDYGLAWLVGLACIVVDILNALS
jgi:hypothetical protein